MKHAVSTVNNEFMQKVDAVTRDKPKRSGHYFIFHWRGE